MTNKATRLFTAMAIIAAGGASAYAGTAVPSKTEQPRRAPARGAGLSLAPDGIAAVTISNGHTSRLNFGAPMDNAVQMVSAVLGTRPVADSVNTDCGAGATRIVRFGNGLQLLGQGNRFQGWETDRAGIGTIDGIDVGTSRVRLNRERALVQQGSLGTEFSIGDGDAALGGLLSTRNARGRVTVLWAGLTCHMS